MSSNEGITVEYVIHVDSNSNAVLTANPAVAHLRKDMDSVTFSSNDARTVIKYGATSPFAEPEIGPGILLRLDRKKGPFKCRNVGNHHFDCGFINDRKFQPWGKTTGADTPIMPKAK
jgi:hypothetical protein